MLSGNNETQQTAARIHELISERQAWNRRLWSIGSVLALRELVEAVEAKTEGVLSEDSVNYLANVTCVQVGPDPGVGQAPQREILRQALQTRPLRPDSLAVRTISQGVADMEGEYLKRWADAISRSGSRTSVERTARNIASHLLDSDFSSEFLAEWWSNMLRRASAAVTFPELLEQAHALVSRANTAFQVLVGFASVGRGVATPSRGWLQGREAVAWIRQRGFSTSGLRLHGALVATFHARDPWAAAEKARQLIDQLSSRAAVGSTNTLEIADLIWVQGAARPFAAQRPRRGVNVHSLEREEVLFESRPHDRTESAIDLLSLLDNGPPGAAAAGGWAAIESLLLGRGEGVERVSAADRMAELVACSFPRAELTTLGYRHAASASDALAASIRSAANNRERANCVAAHLIAGHGLSLTPLVDIAAQERLRKIIREPIRAISDIQGYIQQAARRLYRQRNLVMHAGRLRGVALSACLRTTAPLVGAAVDRICHAGFRENADALDLVGRARRKLASISGGVPDEITGLLEP